MYHGLPSLLTRVAGEELERLGEAVSECSVIYLPQVGVARKERCLLMAFRCSTPAGVSCSHSTVRDGREGDGDSGKGFGVCGEAA